MSEEPTEWHIYVGKSLIDVEHDPITVLVEPEAAERLHNRDRLIWAGVIAALPMIAPEQFQ